MIKKITICSSFGGWKNLDCDKIEAAMKDLGLPEKRLDETINKILSSH